MVGRVRAGAGRNVVDGWTAIEQGQRLRGAPVVLQATRIELGVGVLQIARTREAARGPTLQVVALVADPTKWIGAVVGSVTDHDALGDAHRAGVVKEAAALADGSRVVGKGAVADARRAASVVDAAAVEGDRVVGKGAVADAHCAAEVGDAAALAVAADGRVVGKGAVADAQHPAAVEEAAAVVVGRAIGNGEGVEREGDAAVHDQHLHAVAARESDLLPAAVQGQVLADPKRRAEGDRATTAEGDGVSAGRAVDGVAQGGVIAGADDDGRGWLGVGRPAGKPEAGEHADPEQQGESDEARPGRETDGVLLIHDGCSFLCSSSAAWQTDGRSAPRVRTGRQSWPACCCFS